MTHVTVKTLAAEIKTSVKRLLVNFANAGIPKLETDSVSQCEKEILFSYLNNKDNSNTSKLTLQRKTRSTLNVSCMGGKTKLVQIEFRKKHTYITNNIDIEDNKEEFKKNHIHNETIIQTKRVPLENTKVINKPTATKLSKATQLYKNNHGLEKTNFSYKTEENIRKLKKVLNKRVCETRILPEKKIHQIEKNTEIKDYHLTTSTHARQAEDENDRQVESGIVRTRITKVIRQTKRSNKHTEAKTDREEARAILRTGKNINKQRNQSILQQSFNKPSNCINRDIMIGETITVSELANKMAVKSSLVIKAIMKMGAMVTINQIIDQDTAQLVAEEMGHKVIILRENALETALMDDRDTINASKEARAPVVTIMGHVDHGKTSLLDYIRSTKVAVGEAGGITQHIGAYHVKTSNGMVTFLDTPGHAAFTAMRARGVQTTDIVVLVIAGDDGVMPQTVEAIQHAKLAKVPIIVAINKIDKVSSDPERIKHELTSYGILSEEWGGENMFVNISAKTGIGIDSLINTIILQAEMLELTAVHVGMASGIVIESFLDKGRGPIATVLIREGTLIKGNIVLCGLEYGRVRAMRDEFGKEILKAGPSIPVEILGLSGIPNTGDVVTVVRNEKKAREVALYRQGKFREVKLDRQKKAKLDNMFSNLNKDGISELNIVLKADVRGSLEAIHESLIKISSDKVRIKIVGSSVGGITETDAMLAIASNAIIVGFNVRADTTARRIIDTDGIQLYYYSVIYNLIDEIKLAMNGMLLPEYKQKIIGLAEVRSVFKSLKFGDIAGCMVIEGNIKKHNPIRILRENIVIYEGELESLRRFKDDVNEVRNGMECGIGVKNYNNIRIHDTIEVFEVIKVKRTID